MINSESLKLQLVQEIISLTDDQLRAVADFINSILGQNGKVPHDDIYPPGRDPLLDYIGGVSHGSLSANIDDELYGEV
jgi:hypothetical protein